MRKSLVDLAGAPAGGTSCLIGIHQTRATRDDRTLDGHDFDGVTDFEVALDIHHTRRKKRSASRLACWLTS